MQKLKMESSGQVPDDATVTNFDELFKTYSPATKRRVI